MTQTKKLPPLKTLITLYDFHFKEGNITRRYCNEIFYFKSYHNMNHHNTRVPEKAFNTRKKNGYYVGQIDYINYSIHRLLYYAYYGEQPEIVDHKDRNPSNNRIENLRASNHNLNMANRKNNTNGIELRASGNYRVVVGYNGKQIHVGTFPSESTALEARNQYIKLHNLDQIKYLTSESNYSCQ